MMSRNTQEKGNSELIEFSSYFTFLLNNNDYKRKTFKLPLQYIVLYDNVIKFLFL